ncbi:hypothetical protein ABFS83_13G042900 [Erythranthe nasuta]
MIKEAYRAVQRATCQTFAGDTIMLRESAAEARKKFEENRLVNSPADLSRHPKEGNEATRFISTMIVQAKLNDRGGYGMTNNKPSSPSSNPIPTSLFPFSFFLFFL